jgi:ubiquinone/menaquinone biosynthesis C-methylase UbiE
MTEKFVCPASWSWGLLFSRRLVHNPAKILKGLASEGNSVADIGCGPGFFTVALSDAVGAAGKVYAVDLQQKMLDNAKKRVEKLCKNKNVTYVKAEKDSLHLAPGLDAALAFYMVHEVPDTDKFFSEIYSVLKPGGRLLVIEPLMHVSKKDFEAEKASALKAGFTVSPGTKAVFSVSMLLEKK